MSTWYIILYARNGGNGGANYPRENVRNVLHIKIRAICGTRGPSRGKRSWDTGNVLNCGIYFVRCSASGFQPEDDRFLTSRRINGGEYRSPGKRASLGSHKEHPDRNIGRAGRCIRRPIFNRARSPGFRRVSPAKTTSRRPAPSPKYFWHEELSRRGAACASGTHLSRALQLVPIPTGLSPSKIVSNAILILTGAYLSGEFL